MSIDTLKFIKQLFLYAGFLCSIFLLIGLFKPWTMLWWEDIQNRRKVIKIYGIAGVIFFSMYLGLGYYLNIQ